MQDLFLQFGGRLMVSQKQPPDVFYEKGALKNFAKFAGKLFIKKEMLAQIFSRKFFEIFENNFFYRTPPGDYFWFLVSN